MLMLRSWMKLWSPPPPKSAAFIREGWDRFSKLPGGRRLYSRWLGRLVPYTGSVLPEVVELRPGFARVQMRDRPALRNHLSSLHAVALCNLAEVTANLAFGYGLPDGSRFIVTSIRIQYLKKARGTIEARCVCEVPETNERREHSIDVELFDSHDTLVARATVESLVSPAPALS